jgi:hypothetical protein
LVDCGALNLLLTRLQFSSAEVQLCGHRKSKGLTLVIIPKVSLGILMTIGNSVVRLFFFPRREEYNVFFQNQDAVKDILRA